MFVEVVKEVKMVVNEVVMKVGVKVFYAAVSVIAHTLPIELLGLEFCNAFDASGSGSPGVRLGCRGPFGNRRPLPCNRGLERWPNGQGE